MKRILIPIFTIFLIFLCSQAWAGTAYYCDLSNAGVDSGSAGTFADPFVSILECNNTSFSTGDDLYFKAGESETTTVNLVIDWSGNSGDRVIIGAYDGDGDFDITGSARPIIDGNSQTVPSSESGLVRYYNQTGGYVTIQDLRVSNSKYYGIEVAYQYVDGSPQFANVTVKDCYIYRSRYHGIALSRGEDCIIEDNIVEEAGYNIPSGVIAGIAVLWEGTEDITIKENKVFGCKAEGIGAYRKVTRIIIENNTVYDNSTVNIYVDAGTSCTIRYNLSYSSSSVLANYGWDETTWGICIDNELAAGYCNTGSHKIYGNLIAGVKQGIVVTNEYGITNPTCDQDNNLIYNNTTVDCLDYNFYFDSQAGWTGNEVKNNISYTITAGSNHIYPTTGSPTGFTFTHNNFDEDPGGNANDNAVIGVPGISKTSGWQTLTAGSVEETDFDLINTSVCIDAATYLTEVNDTGATAADCDVDNSGWFYGDEEITIGTDQVTLTGVTGNNIQWTGNITFVDNDDVWFRHFSGVATDIGANEFEGETTELRAEWNFEDGALTTDSTGTYTLTNVNTVVSSATHKEGSHSADFTSGNSEYFTRTGTADDFAWTTTHAFTICMWLQADNLPAGGQISEAFSKGTVPTGDYDFSIYLSDDGSPNVCIGYNAGANYECETFTGGNFVVDQWYYL